MQEKNYKLHEVSNGVPVKMWTRGVPVEDEAQKQLENAARLPIVFKHIAAMPDAVSYTHLTLPTIYSV